MTQAILTGRRGEKETTMTLVNVTTNDDGLIGETAAGKKAWVQDSKLYVVRGNGHMTLMRNVSVDDVLGDDGSSMINSPTPDPKPRPTLEEAIDARTERVRQAVSGKTPDPKPVNLKPEDLNRNQLNGGKGLTRVQIAQRAVDRLEEKLVGARARLAKALSLTDES